MKKITGEQPFSTNKSSFAISPSAEGYTLNYSANGIDYTPWEKATPAGENVVVNGASAGLYFKLVGNVGEVTVSI